MSTGMYYWGIDPSTTKAAYAGLDADGKIIKSVAIHPSNKPTMGRIRMMRDSLNLWM